MSSEKLSAKNAVLLYCVANFLIETNYLVFDAVHEYIKESHHFDKKLKEFEDLDDNLFA